MRVNTGAWSRQSCCCRICHHSIPGADPLAGHRQSQYRMCVCIGSPRRRIARDVMLQHSTHTCGRQPGPSARLGGKARRGARRRRIQWVDASPSSPSTTNPTPCADKHYCDRIHILHATATFRRPLPLATIGLNRHDGIH